MADADRTHDSSRAAVEADIRRFFVERSGGAFGPDAIHATEHLFDAGYVDSMNALTLLDFIEERYGVVIPEVELVGGLSSIEALSEYVARHATSGS